ncbi:MAG: hypothetical protein RIC15_07050 [Vicingaceae bacterium]
MQKYIKHFIILALLFASVQTGRSQSNFKLFKKIEIQGRLISTDQLGNMYAVVKNNVYKYSRDGELINQFSNNRYGKVTSIDATDPYKIVVFYEDFRTIVILDNQLSENASPLDLQFTDFDQPILACRAYNTGVWLFDQLLNNIYRLTLSLKVVQSSGNLSQILQYDLKPNFMIEYNNNLYLNNPETGILVFDQFGTYVKNIAINGLESFEVTEKAIFYVQNGKIAKYHFRNLEIEKLPLPIEDVLGLSADKNRLFILTSKALFIYDFMG